MGSYMLPMNLNPQQIRILKFLRRHENESLNFYVITDKILLHSKLNQSNLTKMKNDLWSMKKKLLVSWNNEAYRITPKGMRCSIQPRAKNEEAILHQTNSKPQAIKEILALKKKIENVKMIITCMKRDHEIYWPPFLEEAIK